MRFLRRVAIVLVVVFCVLPGPALAFDTGPHADMTRDALTAEGFSTAAADVAMINNWFVDYYTNPAKNPYSGHAHYLLALARLSPRTSERWPDAWVQGAQRMHFDAERRAPEMPDLSTTTGIDREWRRIAHLTQGRLRDAARKNDPLLVLTAMGVSLHALQDFYTHSNWVEDPAAFGRGGPGLAGQGYGDKPTWFDVPRGVRDNLTGNRGIYTGVAGIPRGHGHWKTDRNESLFGGLNKDWPGRPKFDAAYITAYFASRQWVRAMRTWLGNDSLWASAMATRATSELAHDVNGAVAISTHSGHWQGGGEPCVPFSCGERTGAAGSVTSLLLALKRFHNRRPTRYRQRFNETIAEWGTYPAELPSLPDLPTTRTEQQATRFVKLEVLGYSALALDDPAGKIDGYARARINGQSYVSTVINDRDNFVFPGVYAPFTWFRAVSTPHAASMPVTSMTVRIETGDKRLAGTDDDVYLRINGNLRFPLEKRGYNDFERGDDDTYSVPIGAATREGLTMRDIDRVVIEKSRDGAAGGWFLRGVTLTVNGRDLVRERAINRWLQDAKRVWTAPRLARDHRTADVVPVWLEFKDDDYNSDDTGDINSYDRHTSQPIAYQMGTFLQRRVTGGSRLSGRLPFNDGDRARLTYKLTTLAPIFGPR